jgi:hypothetical protein
MGPGYQEPQHNHQSAESRPTEHEPSAKNTYACFLPHRKARASRLRRIDFIRIAAAGSQQASAGPYNAWVSTSQFQASAVEDQPDCAQRLHDHGGQSEPKIGANHAVSYWRRVRD